MLNTAVDKQPLQASQKEIPSSGALLKSPSGGGDQQQAWRRELVASQPGGVQAAVETLQAVAAFQKDVLAAATNPITSSLVLPLVKRWEAELKQLGTSQAQTTGSSPALLGSSVSDIRASTEAGGGGAAEVAQVAPTIPTRQGGPARLVRSSSGTTFISRG